MFRLGLQLGGTSAAERPIETTGEFQLIAIPDGGVALLVGGGANLMWPNGSYAGPAVSFILGDEPIPTLGARAGIRPRSLGLRPEVRADYILHQRPTLLLTLSLGLEVH